MSRIRIVIIDDSIWFVAKDNTDALNDNETPNIFKKLMSIYLSNTILLAFVFFGQRKRCFNNNN